MESSTGYQRPIMLWKPRPELTGLHEIVTFDNGSPAPEDNTAYVQADNNTGGCFSYRQYWVVSNHSIPVPATQWVSVELYLHRGTGSDGRFHWGVNGQTIADHSGWNYERINLLMFSIVYGDGRPAYQ